MNTIKNTALQNQLEDMIDDLFMYRTREVRIKAYSIIEGEVKIVTDKRNITFPLSKLEEELDNFLPIDEENQSIVSQPDKDDQLAKAVFQNDAEQMNKLENVLMDNISKLQEEDGEKYLDQAKEINSTVNTMLEMSKQKLEMAKEMRKARQLSNS